jgi:ABC-2 type transport system permease protein
MTGLMAVFWKEFSDYLFSWRFLVFLLLIYGFAVMTISAAANGIRQDVSMSEGTQFIFMRLFIVKGTGAWFSLPLLLAYFIPVLAIALGFDAINSERNSGNLSRLLSQPIYRDAVINGKFLASLAIIFILITSMFLVVGGLGLRMIGVPPTSEEILRLFGFIFITLVYGAFWLALAILFSVLFKRTATTLIVSVAIVLLLVWFLPYIAQGIADIVASPITQSSTIDQFIKWYGIFNPINHISPTTLFSETVRSLMLPDIANASALYMSQGGVDYASSLLPLPLVQSILNVWPQIIALIALSVICFAASYIKFQREEVRST